MKRIPLPVWRLMVAYALMMSGASMMVLIAGIIGTDLAPVPGLATLPIALTVIGVAASTLPTGKLMHRVGRRPVFLVYGVLSIIAALAATLSLVHGSFIGFCLAALAIGWAGAAGHQYRFSALEQVEPELAPLATSVLLFGGIFGAFVGPEIAVGGRYLLPTEFAGSYLGLACVFALGLIIISFHREKDLPAEDHADGGRPLLDVVKQPVVLLAVSSAAVAYGLMSLLMVATPISMHEHAGHELEATKWVIQSHIAAMYLPSLVFGLLYGKLGVKKMIWSGIAVYGLTLVVAFAGVELFHYWVSLVLLGLGWNLLFLTSTNLLPLGYRSNERFRVQSFSDFVTFSVQAVASLGSGWLLLLLGWQGLLAGGAGLLALFTALFLFLSLKKEI